MSARQRKVKVTPLMGSVASVHVVPMKGADLSQISRAIDDALDSIREVEEVFSPFKIGSDISRIGREELEIENAHPDVRVVAELCAEAERVSGGLFSAWWKARYDSADCARGAFDPTGYVKGWAVERAFKEDLTPLLRAQAEAVGISLGGDLQVATRSDSLWEWSIGIADPHDRHAILATLILTNGAVATSGSAERGAHIIDPRTGNLASTSVVSATVVADSLATAEVWATAAVVSGFDSLEWLPASNTRFGLLVSPDMRLRQWVNQMELVDVVNQVTLIEEDE